MTIIIALAIFFTVEVGQFYISGLGGIFTNRNCFSGNGLVSYYINLVLEGVGITETNTKAAINGGLQVRCLSNSFRRSLRTNFRTTFRFGIS